MSSLLGNVALIVGLLLQAAGLVAVLAGVRLGSVVGMRLARWAMPAVWLAFTLAGLALTGALLDGDFSISYVARYTERALPTGYKLAALWAGQEGSLLLWAWLIAGLGSLWAAFAWQRNDRQHTIAAGVLVGISVFFTVLMLYVPAASPFTAAAQVLEDGQGLNPLLQDPAMIAHPPFLFLGYAGFAVPFAIMLGVLGEGRRDNVWVVSVRRWTLAAWMFLTVGIILGAWWAYIELGWGGYWAWDPVENASLLPWLTATALLHSISVQQQRGMLKRSNVVLIGMNFILCVLATYITRSGIVQSVHSFAGSAVSTFFLVFLVLVIVASVAMMVWRWRLLVSEHALETIWGREGLFLIGNVVLVAMMMLTAGGTLFPALSRLVTEREISVGQPFYASVVIPLALLLLAIMALGPLLEHGNDAGKALRRRVVWPMGGGLVGVVVAAALGMRDYWALACVMIAGAALAAVLVDLVWATRLRMRTNGENVVMAGLRLVDANHRRYGGQTAHVGMILLMAGVAGSSLYGEKHELMLTPGQSASVGRWGFTFQEITEKRYENFIAVEATLRMEDSSGGAMLLRPQRRFYERSDRSTSEVALRSDGVRDVYVLLAGYRPDGGQAAFQVRINPLVLWIWIGGIVMTAGALFGLMPRVLRHPVVGERGGGGRAEEAAEGGKREALAATGGRTR